MYTAQLYKLGVLNILAEFSSPTSQA